MEAELKPIIQCQLCKKTLKDPRYLPCLHTFCRSCIDNNAKETIRSESTRTYYCPKCCRVAKFPNDVSMSKWGDHLPKNKLASNVIDGYRIKTGNVICKPCNRKRKSAKATQWCIKCKEPLCDHCVESHSSFKATMGHDVTSVSTAQSRPIKELLISPLCDEHQEELDHYCYDHEKFVCSTCKANIHRSCKSVFAASVYAQKARDDSKATAYSIDQHERNAKILLENRMNEKESLEVSKVKITEQITSVRRKINDLLTKYEKQCLKEMEDIYSKERQILETDILGVQGIYNTSNNMNQVLKVSSKHANDVHFVEWQDKIERETQMLNDIIYDIHEPLTSPRISFSVNPVLENVMQAVRNLGGFTIKKEKVKLISGLEKPSEIIPSDKPDQLDNTSMLSLQMPLQEYNIKTRNDEHACYITGMTMLPSNLLICADKNNSKLKVFDSELQLQHEHQLEFPPFDLTSVEGNKFAATIPTESIISIYSIDANLVHKKSIKTDVPCYGLTYSNKRYAFTCPFTTPSCVKMITNTGQSIMTICPVENYQSLFLRPWYVKFDQSGSHLYVSDCTRAHIYCCVGTSLRRFVYTHDRLNAPRGLILKTNDDFFVVGWGSDNVHCVDRHGEFITEVVNRWNGSFSPQTVCLSHKEDKIIVSLDPTSCNSDVLLVYDLPDDIS